MNCQRRLVTNSLFKTNPTIVKEVVKEEEEDVVDEDTKPELIIATEPTESMDEDDELPEGVTLLTEEGEPSGHLLQLGDGSTIFVPAINDGLLDGQSLSLEDGTNFVQENNDKQEEIEGTLQLVELDDGSTAYVLIENFDPNEEETVTVSKDESIVVKEVEEDKKSQQQKSARVKSFRCSFAGCTKTYTTQHHLKVHERKHTGIRPFQCIAEGCNKAFSTSYSLKSHVRTHTGEKPYECPHDSCSKSFKTSGDLQKHVRTHTGERPFRCTVEGCDRSFTTSNIRKVHLRTHTGERPYHCPEPGCTRSFASATNYKNHVRIHSGEKPYLCTVAGCNKRFTEYSSLYKHQIVHSQHKPYYCTICSRNYRQAYTLTMHKRSAHGIMEGDDGTEIVLDEDFAAELFATTTPSKTKKRKQATITVPTSEGMDEVCMQLVNPVENLEDSKPTTTLVAMQGASARTIQEVAKAAASSCNGPIFFITDPTHIAALEQIGVTTKVLSSRQQDESDN